MNGQGFTLPRDANGFQLEALCPDPGNAVNVNLEATPSRIQIPGNSLIISLYATVGYYIKLGDDSVIVSTSNCHRLPSSITIISTQEYTHISVIRDGTADGVLNVGRLK